MAKKKKAMRIVRIVLFQGAFRIWKKDSNQQAVPGFKTKVRPVAVRAAKQHGYEPELYGGAKRTLRVA